MSKYVSQRILLLRELLSRDLSIDSLDRISKECAALLSDGKHLISAYIVQHVCEEISEALDSDVPHVDRHVALTRDIKQRLAAVLDSIESRGEASSEDLRQLISTHLSNLALFPI